MQTSEISLAELRRDLEAVIKRVAAGRERVVVLDKSRPAAILVNVEEFRSLEQAGVIQDSNGQAQRTERRDWLAHAAWVQHQIAERVGGKLPDSVQELNQLRDERTDELASLR